MADFDDMRPQAQNYFEAPPAKCCKFAIGLALRSVIITLLEKLSGRRNFCVLAVLAEKTLSQRWHSHLKNRISFDDVSESNLILEGFYIVSLSSTYWNS
ncbi:hypothetical protein AVEN_65829-1 [Araneus ventricosus]|uniref:Uncharacterized protein n=1 Tax=Araneus ventricosus TaxID=182803 RepID=A0A4Y2VEI0_ARAVE|nr:hypothetical protein AVEN_271300-1 [Araneus ventricosus]GBO22992.1 hypothetical protein AVEN_38909-1 [Araneus ventricosus]GBO22994.1 hypothetical protein AVEN_65829-1 [Araneus ventricosus]